MGVNAAIGVAALGIPPDDDLASLVVEGTLEAVGPGLPGGFCGSFNVNIWPSINTPLSTTNGSLAFAVTSGAGLAAGDSVNSINVPQGTTIATIAGDSGTLALPAVSLVGRIDATSLFIRGLLRTDGLLGAEIVSPNIPAGTLVANIIEEARISGPDPGGGVIEISALPNANNTKEPIIFELSADSITTAGDLDALFTGAAMTFVGTVQLEKSYDGGFTWLCAGIGDLGQQAVFTTGLGVAFVARETEPGILYRVNCPAYTSGVINYRLSQKAYAATAWGIPPG